MDSYITIQGDTWDIIALKTLGSEKLMGKLLEANPGYADITVFGAGKKLVVPDYTAPADEQLPPWKRGLI
jgi:phage tail protein X